jgi:hypothetical protein
MGNARRRTIDGATLRTRTGAASNEKERAMTTRVARKAPLKKASSETVGETTQADPKTFITVHPLVEEVTVLGRRNIDALVHSSAIISRAVEGMGRELLAYIQFSLDSGMSAGAAMMTARNLRELLDIQHQLICDSLDKALIHGTKVSELSFRMAQSAMEPVSVRLSAMVGWFAKPIVA